MKRKHNWATVGMARHVNVQCISLFVRMTPKSDANDPVLPDAESLRRIVRDINRVILTMKIGVNLHENLEMEVGNGPFITHNQREVSGGFVVVLSEHHTEKMVRSAVRSACALLRSNNYRVRLIAPTAKQLELEGTMEIPPLSQDEPPHCEEPEKALGNECEPCNGCIFWNSKKVTLVSTGEGKHLEFALCTCEDSVHFGESVSEEHSCEWSCFEVNPKNCKGPDTPFDTPPVEENAEQDPRPAAEDPPVELKTEDFSEKPVEPKSDRQESPPLPRDDNGSRRSSGITPRKRRG